MVTILDHKEAIQILKSYTLPVLGTDKNYVRYALGVRANLGISSTSLVTVVLTVLYFLLGFVSNCVEQMHCRLAIDIFFFPVLCLLVH